MMKTRNIHLIILIALAALFCGNGNVLAQERTDYTFDLRNGRVRFRTDKQIWYSDSPGHEILIPHNDNNYYTITSGGEPTTNRINIETKNLYPSAINSGCTYNIILDNVIIDRRSEVEHNLPESGDYAGLSSGLGGGLLQDPTGTGDPAKYQTNTYQYQYYHQVYACFDAGDGTVDVNIYLKGHNEIRSGEGVFAGLQYQKWCSAAEAGSYIGYVGDTAAYFNGVWREGKLRILNGSGDDNNPGTLLVTKEIYVNSGAAIGGPFTGAKGRNGWIQIEGGKVTALTGDPRIVYNTSGSGPLLNSTYSYGAYGAAIGGGGCSRSGNITINGGTVTARSSATAAAIGGGGGQHGKGSAAQGTIEINGGTVNVYCRGNGLAHDTGVGIGGGSGLFNGGAEAKSIIITGGTITAYKWHYTDLDHFYDTLAGGTAHWEADGHIGGGHSNVAGWAYGEPKEANRGNGGNANITITGGTITAGSIGGGVATRGKVTQGTIPDPNVGSKGGDVNLTINMTSGSLNVAGKLGGGNSWAGDGGTANITIVKGTVNAGSIGGGDSTNDGTGTEPANYEYPNGTMVNIPMTEGHGGTATVNGSGGTLNVTGKIGGGTTAGTGNGGNASVIITGGELDCASIGGGNSHLGSPGSVISASGAGVQISQASSSVPTILKTGFIGGGKNTEGTVGYATATMSGGTVQGQFVLTNSGSNHSYFTMSGGLIDNTDLTGVNTGAYPRLRENGGAVSMADTGGEVTITGGTIQNCKGSTNGGAIYTDGAVSFSNGTIQNNEASTNGGAIYIASGGSITISGTANIINNNVGSGNGGGIYVGGTITANGSSLVVNNNTKGTAKTQTANNVYLPSGKEINVGSSLSPNVYMGITTENTATLSTKIPVLHGTQTKLSEIYLAMHGGTSKIRDDRGIHYPYYNSATDADDLYFAFVEFDYPAFTTDFSGDIDSPEQLYKFMCWVNGVNGFGTAHPGATGNVTADISMSGFTKLWIPIGEDNVIGYTSPYTGTFNGNGHTISGLNMTTSDYLYTNYGLFGSTEGATIQDVFVKDFTFTKTGAGTAGCIVGDMKGGTLSNSGGTGSITATNSGCIIGGLVGKAEMNSSDDAVIHSTFATPSTLTGYQIGGLVGELASGCKLYNSFAAVRLAGQSGNDKYVGCLVGVNNGRVENCYVRMGGDTPAGKFGYLAGNNTAVSEQGLYYCYVYDTYTPYVSTSGTAGNQTGLGKYGDTYLPYLYKHRDNQVNVDTPAPNPYVSTVATTDKQMLIALNNWVTAQNTDVSNPIDFTPWLRPWQKSSTAKWINADFPILRMPGANAVAATSATGNMLDYNDINTLLTNYTASTDNILLYGSKTGMNSNSSSLATLYIDEKAVLTQADNATNINATVSIMLDNSAGSAGANPTWGGSDAIDWHMFSASLTSVPLGINYAGDENQYLGGWGHPETEGGTSKPYYRFYPENNANHGYFPSMEYSWAADNSFTYNSTNTGPATYGNYYNEWDFYAYYEPVAHWINFKRNGKSHWLEPNATVHIDYCAKPGATANQNESSLIEGKGYLVATVEPTLLQATGILNKGDGITLGLFCQNNDKTGYNLLGNPYQSYLDFNEFASKNSGEGKIWSDKSRACYYIIDEDYRGYMKYAYNASENEFIAQSYLHPHQGFMVIAENAATVVFKESMRNTSRTDVTFRGQEHPAYPLVNLIATEENGNRDICTVELGRPDKGGAPVLRNLRVGKGLIYCHYDDSDWAIAFTQPGVTEIPVRFETAEDGEFTLTWNTQNGDFGYLHLIDNLTGTDIDCLATDQYKFNSKTTDYASRFRLMFDYTGVDENGDGPSTGSGTFAFMMGDELVVNGEGDLAIYDMTGRLVKQASMRGQQSTIAMPDVAAGVYMLRLVSKTNGMKTQKIVIR